MSTSSQASSARPPLILGARERSLALLVGVALLSIGAGFAAGAITNGRSPAQTSRLADPQASNPVAVIPDIGSAGPMPIMRHRSPAPSNSASTSPATGQTSVVPVSPVVQPSPTTSSAPETKSPAPPAASPAPSSQGSGHRASGEA